jgi:hypothetical protein
VVVVLQIGGRDRELLEPEVLAVVAMEELLPQLVLLTQVVAVVDQETIRLLRQAALAS